MFKTHQNKTSCKLLRYLATHGTYYTLHYKVFDLYIIQLTTHPY